jgi:hypothetical protein
LFHHRSDPYEWENLAGDGEYAGVKAAFARQLPAESVPTLEPRGLRCGADADLDDMEHFRQETWPRWLSQAAPPLV